MSIASFTSIMMQFLGRFTPVREAHLGSTNSSLESFQGQIEGLRQEVKQLAHLCSNRQADRYTSCCSCMTMVMEVGLLRKMVLPSMHCQGPGGEEVSSC